MIKGTKIQFKEIYMLSLATFFERIAKITTQVKSQQLGSLLTLFSFLYMYTDLNEITQFIEQ